MAITRDSGNIIVSGHDGTWYTVDAKSINGIDYFLMEHEEYGDEALHVIIDKNGALVLQDVANGFDDLEEFLTDKLYKRLDNLEGIKDNPVYEAEIKTIREELSSITQAFDTAQPQRLFIDMDGTLAVFTPVDRLETLYEPGYFANLKPMKKVINAVRDIHANHPEIEVFVLSSYLSDSKCALIEKNQWLDEHLPGLDAAHRIFCPCGEDKKAYVPDGIRPTDVLMDDYTHNLTLWHPPARGIKLLNGINHSNGTWKHDRIRYDKPPKELAENIVSIMQGAAIIKDAKPQSDVQAPPSLNSNYYILQLKEGDANRYRRFTGLKELQSDGESPDIRNYKLVYAGELDAKDDLYSLYKQFNMNRPADFTGHSLSVSDIIVIENDNGITAHYIDSFGFTEIPGLPDKSSNMGLSQKMNFKCNAGI